jgi:hypothetical protein
LELGRRRRLKVPTLLFINKIDRPGPTGGEGAPESSFGGYRPIDSAPVKLASSHRW